MRQVGSGVGGSSATASEMFQPSGFVHDWKELCWPSPLFTQSCPPCRCKVVGWSASCWTGRFFCWRLLGLIPGGAPFSQLSRGVKDAMVVSTKLAKCHFDKNMQIKKKANRNNTQKRVKQESIHRECQDCKRGLR